MSKNYKKIKAQLGLNSPGPQLPFYGSLDQMINYTIQLNNLYGPDWQTQKQSDPSNPLETVSRTNKLGELQPYKPMDFSGVRNTPPTPDEKRKRDYLADALLGLGLVNTLIPDNTNNSNIVRPEISYNPNMYGTGSQAIYEKGGKLSASKAREMLKDGTAHGKKLTKKQKRYFGMVAAGKALFGEEVPGDPKNTPTPQQLEAANKLAREFAARRGQINPEDTHVGNTLPEVTFDGKPIQYGAPLPINYRTRNYKPIPSYATEVQYDQRTNTAWYTNRDGDLVEMDPRDMNLPQFTKNNKKTLDTSPNQDMLAQYKKGGSIHIKKENRGKFTAAAKRAGMGVQEYAKKVLNDPNASPTLKKRANFARNAAKWKHEDGGEIEFDGNLKQPLDIFEFKGPSHAQGGIDIAYAGKQVEVEGGETAFIGGDGDLNILGNMNIPGTKVKFKTAGKVIAKEEEKNNKLMNKGLTLLEEHEDPLTAAEAIKFKTGKVMAEGAKMQEMNLNRSKERLAQLQQAMLQGMNQGYAQRGAVVGEDDPKKKSMAVRMNNPGNIKYGEFAKKYGAVKGDPATDGGFFAKFPDTNTGLNALKGLLRTKNYKDLPVDAAIKRWTNNAGYAVDYKDIANKKISELAPQEFDKLVNTITFGEDSKYYTPDIQTPPGVTPPRKTVPVPGFDPFNLPDAPMNQAPPAAPGPNNPEYVPYNNNIVPPSTRNPAPYQSPLDWRQLTGEIYSLVTNQVEPVPMQKFTPELESPYSVSFQDRLNANQSTFNALQKATSSNPEALSVLAGQKYAADSNVLGEEFRVNQSIFNEITNRNLTKLDQAEMTNLGLADQQLVRQSTARSKTKAQTQLTLQSIGDKSVKNRYENLDSAFKQMMFKYRPVDKDNDGVFESLEYMGDAPTFTPGAAGTSTDESYIRTRTKQDALGNVKEVQKTEPSDMEKQQIRAKALKAYWDISVNQYNNLFKRSR